MGSNTNIAWTDHTYNHWIGCTKVSMGCLRCYAEEWDRKRFTKVKDANGKSKPIHWGPGAPRHLTSIHNQNEPYRWNRMAIKNKTIYKVFCSSLSDVFDDEVPQEWRISLFKIIKECTNLTWLILTKRPENALTMLPSDWNDGYSNVWFGVTTEDQKMADKRIEELRIIKCKIKFLSVEPQLEEIDFTKWLTEDVPPFHQMIFGGESGEGARKFDPEWIKTPIEQATKKGIAVFVKQMGTMFANKHGLASKKGDNPDEWADWLKRREFPA